PQVGLVFLCNPGNPTGHLIKKADRWSFMEQCQRHNVFMVLDEAFMDFVENGEAITLIEEAQRQKNLIVLRSLTRFFALPGLRIGYMVANSELIQRIRPSQAPWSVNALAQLAGRAAMKDRVYIRRSQEYIWKERQRLYQALKKINGLHPYRPTANFLFCQLTSDKIN